MAAPATAAPALRQFAFFDVVPVKDIHDATASPELLKSPNEISCMTSASAGVLLADIHGTVHLLGKDFEAEQSWIAHASGRVMHMVARKGILVTVGDEDGSRYPLLKIWDLQRFDTKSGQPALLRTAKVQHNNKPHPVTTVALAGALTHLALGLADGTVLLYRHLDQALSTPGGAALPKPRVVHESPAEPVTGLGFREPAPDGADALVLFVVTTARVLACATGGRAAPAHVVDDAGAPLGCAAMGAGARELVVAREDAVYVCSPDGRGTCLVLEGTKASVHAHAHYLLTVAPPAAPSLAAASRTVRNAAAVQRGGELTRVTLLDLANKLVAFSGAFPDGVRAAVSCWGRLFVLSHAGALSCIAERPTAAKLAQLYERGQYTLALALAKTQGLDAQRTADVHRHYGDYLYARGEFDGAMAQYVRTLGSVPPSYVVRKFLDAQRIQNLVAYLQELHALGLAHADHTTLLLNTYAKLGDVPRLDAFVRTESTRAGAAGALPFDLDTAIRVCSQAGFFAQAGFLARKYARHEDYLRIQVEEAEQFADALEYIRALAPEAAESSLGRYGRQLLDALPDETTQLMIDVCVGAPAPAATPAVAEGAEPASPKSAGPSYLSFMALSRPAAAEAPPPPSPTATTVTARPEARRRASLTATATTDEATPSASGTTTPALQPAPAPARPVRRPSPRVFFAHFVHHLDRFVGFLEAVAARRWGQAVDGAAPAPAAEPPLDADADRADQAAVWNTLLELYLTLPPDAPDDSPARAKALRLLQRAGLPYDPTHALILCSTRAFTPGLVLLWERAGMHEDALRLWMDRARGGDGGASDEVVRALRAYGPGRPALYPLVLRFLTSSKALLARHRADVADVLEHIEREKIMSPVEVVQALSRNDVASVGLVKQWLMTRIREAREEIKTDEQLTESYRAETAAKLKQVAELQDAAAPRMFHARCTMCREALSLPAVHFMCGHSYHAGRCLQAHDEAECPSCARAHGVVRELRASNARLAGRHELFLADVREGGFAAVASAFGRGVLNEPAQDVGA